MRTVSLRAKSRKKGPFLDVAPNITALVRGVAIPQRNISIDRFVDKRRHPKKAREQISEGRKGSLSVCVGVTAIGTKQTYRVALHMSAIGGKADMPFCTASVRF